MQRPQALVVDTFSKTQCVDHGAMERINQVRHPDTAFNSPHGMVTFYDGTFT